MSLSYLSGLFINGVKIVLNDVQFNHPIKTAQTVLLPKSLREEMTNLRAELESQEQEVKHYKGLVSYKAIDACNQVKEEVTQEYEEKLNQKDQQIEEAKQTISQVRSNYAAKAKEFQDLLKERNKLAEDLRDNEEQLKNANKSNSDNEKTIARLNTKVTEEVEARKALAEENKNLKDQIRQNTENINRVGQELAQTKRQLEQKTNQGNKQLEQINKQKGVIDTQKTKIQTITDQLREEKAKPRKPDDYEDIKRQLQEERTKTRRLEQQLAQPRESETQCEETKRKLEGEKLAIQRDMNKILRDLAEGKKVVITSVSREVQTLVDADTVRDINQKLEEQNRKLLQAGDLQKSLTLTSSNLDREREARQELEAENTQNKNLATLYKGEADKFRQENAKLQERVAELMKINEQLRDTPKGDIDERTLDCIVDVCSLWFK